MNLELLNQFYNGEVIIQIESNEQANELIELAENAVSDLRDEAPFQYLGNDASEFPYVVVEHADESPQMNGLRAHHLGAYGLPVISYAELKLNSQHEDAETDLDPEEVL